MFVTVYVVLLHCVPKTSQYVISIIFTKYLTDFQNSFTDTRPGQFTIKQLLNITLHFKCVATLGPNFEIQIFKNHYSQNKYMAKNYFLK